MEDNVQRRRDERGVAMPSPVVILSIVAIAMAAVAYLATQGSPPTEREVTVVARDQAPSASAEPSPSEPVTPSTSPTQKPEKKEPAPPPPVQRGSVFVGVFNNSGITGLAGAVGGQAASAGWQVVTTDNWYGSVPASTVYFPEQLERAGKLLALDLGIDRTMPAVGSMQRDRLTVVLTGAVG